MTLTGEQVTAIWQALELRTLRNECRRWMTGDTSWISENRQREFFRDRIATGAVRAWLLREDGAAVAYGLLRPGDGCAWLSCGVAARARGRGLGTRVVRLVTAAAGGVPVRLEVRRDNAAARRVYLKAGYAVTGTAERDGVAVDVMEHP